MITGRINQDGSPVLSITISGNRNEATVDATLDTGFNGHVCLPISAAIPLGLELTGAVRVELADGTVLQDELEFAGKILWDDQIIDVIIVLTKSDESLIGTGLLGNSDVRLNYRTDQVSIERFMECND